MSIIPHRSRGIRRIFTLIELLIMIAIIAILLTSESIFFMSVYVNGVLGKV